ncbi:hypothetical protein C2845_PM18G05270 [Panicum miliaceum]|uniref:Transposase (putative) gypsy type domain-containing protein n=1 Tax=Panicum miliaceum TaxID=4540 RepID=A0A3L6PMV2_PANMI|nr:hypothetical protein C2845_PM18G05270 [Panicum miliaceum]
MPAHGLLRSGLRELGMGLHHLHPDGLLQLARFVSLCKGVLGVAPNLSLFRRLFVAEGRRAKPDDTMFARVGGVMVVVCPEVAWVYPRLQPAGLFPGWEREWFYVRNDVDGPMLEFAMLPSVDLLLP